MRVQKLKEIIAKDQIVNIVEFRTGNVLYSGALFSIPDDALIWGTQVVELRVCGCLIVTVSWS